MHMHKHVHTYIYIYILKGEGEKIVVYAKGMGSIDKGIHYHGRLLSVTYLKKKKKISSYIIQKKNVIFSSSSLSLSLSFSLLSCMHLRIFSTPMKRRKKEKKKKKGKKGCQKGNPFLFLMGKLMTVGVPPRLLSLSVFSHTFFFIRFSRKCLPQQLCHHSFCTTVSSNALFSSHRAASTGTISASNSRPRRHPGRSSGAPAALEETETASQRLTARSRPPPLRPSTSKEDCRLPAVPLLFTLDSPKSFSGSKASVLRSSSTGMGNGHIECDRNPSFSPSVYLHHHTCLLCAIVSSPNDGLHRKRRRVRGVVRKIVDDAPLWLLPSLVKKRRTFSASFVSSATTPLTSVSKSGTSSVQYYEAKKEVEQVGHDQEVIPFLTAMASAKRLLFEGVPYDSGRGEDGASPFTAAMFQDFISLCVEVATPATLNDPSLLLSLLSAAVALEASGAPLEELCRRVTTEKWFLQSSPHTMCTALHLVSLAVKRCQMVPPSLFFLFSRLAAVSKWESRDVLRILSSLTRLRSPYDMEVSNRVSRFGVDHVKHYTGKDVVFALTAIAYLKKMDECYASEVLRRCVDVMAHASADLVGDVSKYVALLNTSQRQQHTVAASCAPLIQRVVYTIADRSLQLLGKFSLRDAKYVLRCLQQYNVKHSLVFASLVPFALTSE